jgi:hypothetical protein
MQVSDQIIKVLDDVCEKFGLAIDWTSETVLPYVSTLAEHLVKYEIWRSAASMVSMVFWTVVSIILTKKFYPTFKRGWEENSRSYCDVGWEVASVLAMIFLACLWLGTVICINVNTVQIIKCITFPELFVLEYIQDLLKTTS